LRRSAFLGGVGAAVLPVLTLDDLAFAADAPPPAKPVTIRHSWGIPAEEIHYVMMADPSKAPNLGTYYTVDWFRFVGTSLGVQGLAAGTLDGATIGSLSMPNGLEPVSSSRSVRRSSQRRGWSVRTAGSRRSPTSRVRPSRRRRPRARPTTSKTITSATGRSSGRARIIRRSSCRSRSSKKR
jgi:hypothetical protein